jgi:hypothetical protein
LRRVHYEDCVVCFMPLVVSYSATRRRSWCSRLRGDRRPCDALTLGSCRGRSSKTLPAGLSSAHRATTAASSRQSDLYSGPPLLRRAQRRPLRNPTASLTAPCHPVDTPRNKRMLATRPKYSAVFCTRSRGIHRLSVVCRHGGAGVVGNSSMCGRRRKSRGTSFTASMAVMLPIRLSS